MTDTSGYVSHVARSHKKIAERKRIREHFETVGVDDTDVGIAAQLGFSEQLVGNVRREMGLPSLMERRKADLINDPDFDSLPAEVLAKRHGFSANWIRDFRLDDKPRSSYASIKTAWRNEYLNRWAEFTRLAVSE